MDLKPFIKDLENRTKGKVKIKFSKSVTKKYSIAEAGITTIVGKVYANGTKLGKLRYRCDTDKKLGELLSWEYVGMIPGLLKIDRKISLGCYKIGRDVWKRNDYWPVHFLIEPQKWRAMGVTNYLIAFTLFSIHIISISMQVF